MIEEEIMKNIPEVKLGIIAVSRDCFPIGLSIARRENIVKAYDGDIYECKVTVENEKDMIAAVDDVRKAGVNALVVFLGNFGPETPETLIAKRSLSVWKIIDSFRSSNARVTV